MAWFVNGNIGHHPGGYKDAKVRFLQRASFPICHGFGPEGICPGQLRFFR